MGETEYRDDPRDPFDPRCQRFARQMIDYDSFILSIGPHRNLGEAITEDERIAYVILHEGTYNPLNGHFVCDGCYVAMGCPSNPTGWKCP